MATTVNELEYQAFDADVIERGGYQYSTGRRLSSVMANGRLSRLTQVALPWEGANVLDLGCGDGTYTLELYDAGKVKEITAVDPAPAAIAAAQERVAGRRIQFSVCSGYDLPYADGRFDVAHIRGVLHHMEEPHRAIEEALRVASRVFIIEPNGWNPVLKAIEKVSPYHRAHREKSYLPLQLDKWITERGGRIVWRRWAGLVPFFCPDMMARSLKVVEPLVEAVPIVRHVSCAVYALVAERR